MAVLLRLNTVKGKSKEDYILRMMAQAKTFGKPRTVPAGFSYRLKDLNKNPQRSVSPYFDVETEVATDLRRSKGNQSNLPFINARSLHTI